MAFLSKENIAILGFVSVGDNVLISDKASIYNVKNISIGNNVRIDDFCILSAGDGGIEIGNYIHIAAYTSLIGKGKISLKDFCNLSSRVSIYSSNDDYSGEALTNPMVPSDFTNVLHAPVYIGKHVIIGSGSVVLPGVTLSDGAAIGALSLVSKNCEEFSVYSGAPAKYLKKRSRQLLEVENRL